MSDCVFYNICYVLLGCIGWKDVYLIASVKFDNRCENFYMIYNMDDIYETVLFFKDED